MGVQVRGGGGAGGSNPNSPFLLSGTNIIYDPIAAAVVQLILGASADSLTPVNQTLTLQSATAGAAVNTAGATLTIASGAGTGTGAVSTIIFRTPTVAGAGTGAQAMATRLTISSTVVNATVTFQAPAGTAAAPGYGLLDSAGTYKNGVRANFGGLNTDNCLLVAGGFDWLSADRGSFLVTIRSDVSFCWSSSATLTGGGDVFLTRRAAANLQFGAADAASPVAQIVTAQGSRSGTDNNIAGANLTIQAGRGTGNSTTSSISFQTPLAVASGTGAQTMTTQFQVNSIVSGSSLNFTNLVMGHPGTGTFGNDGCGFLVGNTIFNQFFAGLGRSGNNAGGGQLSLDSAGRIAFCSAANAITTASLDMFLTRGGAATLQLGAAASAAPVAQILQAQGSRAGTDTDIGGGNLTLQSGQGTGIGAISQLILRTPTLGVTGSAAQTMSQRVTIDQNATVLRNRFEFSKGADVTAANDLTLGVDGNVFTITGNTQINAITTANWQAGSIITLIFTGTPTVKNNTAGGAGTAVIILVGGGADFVAAAGDNLRLVYNGTNWREISRAVV